MKILFLTTNKKSLNSLNIGICIAKGLLKLDKNFEFLFVTNSDFTDFFYRNKFQFAKLYSSSNNEILTTIKSFSPDIVFFTEPSNEEILLNLKKNGIFTCLLNYNSSQLDGNYDKIFILYPNVDSKNENNIGYIFRKSEKNLSEKKFFKILITLGSGSFENANIFLKNSIKAALKLKHKKVKIHVITGPFFPNPEKYKTKGIILKRYEPNILSLMNYSDLIIAKPSYSSIMDIMSSNKRAILLQQKNNSSNNENTLLKKFLILGYDESEIFHHLNLAYKYKDYPNTPRLNQDPLLAIKTIHDNIKKEKHFQEISLENQNLTSVLANASIKKETLLLDFQNFSWYDLLLLMEYLTHRGVKYFYLRLHKNQIPNTILEKLKHYPIAYIIENNPNLIKTLKEHFLPFVIQKEKDLPNILNIFKENINEIETRIKTIENKKSKILLKNHIENQHLILTEKQKQLNEKISKKKILNNEIYKKINELEFSKEKLLKNIKYKLQKIESEKIKITNKIDSFYNEKIKPLEQEKMQNEYDIYLLLKKHNLILLRELTQKKINKIEEKINNCWDEQEKINNKISQYKDAQNKNTPKLNKFKHYNELITTLKLKRDHLWERFNQLEEQKNQIISEFKLNPNKKIQEYFSLLSEKNKLEFKFNSLVKKKFNPIRMQLAMAESNQSKEIIKLKKQKDDIWTKFLSPLEKQIDIISGKILNLKLNSIFKNYDAKIKKIEEEQQKISSDINKININIEKRKSNNPEFMKIEKKIAFEMLKKKKLNLLEKKLNKEKTKLQTEFENKIKKTMPSKYNKLQAKISILNKEIKKMQTKIKPENEKLYFLSQKSAHLLKGLPINKIEIQLSNYYKRIKEIESSEEIKEINFAIMQLLKDKNIYDEWLNLEEKEQKLRFILQSKNTLYN